MLARFGRAALPKPGGDKIGRRRLDTHFLGFQKLGCRIQIRRRKGHLLHPATHEADCRARTSTWMKFQ
jgi:UDP-N-acetylglucosamine 1-carboxyvinyltransferase